LIFFAPLDSKLPESLAAEGVPILFNAMLTDLVFEVSEGSPAMDSVQKIFSNARRMQGVCESSIGFRELKGSSR
jgi:hypothetical protein